MAQQLFTQALPAVNRFNSPRAWAFSLIGSHEYLRQVIFDKVAEPGWTWFEEGLTYDNAKLAYALIVGGRATGHKRVYQRGTQALCWLVGVLRPIGSNGFGLGPKIYARQTGGCRDGLHADRSNENQGEVIGRLPEPLIKPSTNECDGDGPNVAYSCGSRVHGRLLIIPYGISDYATTFATMPLEQVLAAMK